MNTKLVKIQAAGDLSSQVKEAAALIREGRLVAFPTETVYGLGADALNEEAAAKIYAAKGRPSDNPLIAHIWDLSQVNLIAGEVPDAAVKIMERFWPGPLTIILKKKSIVPDGTTGGLDTVAIRMPSHPVAAALIRESGTVIAAPSANISGRPSPTIARHVYEDMKGRIPMILDGGPVGIGIESTIIDMSAGTPVILRPGYISLKELSEVAGTVLSDPAISGRKKPENVVAKAPGMKYRHYAPQGKMILVEGEKDRVIRKIRDLVSRKAAEGYRAAVLATDETIEAYHGCRADLIKSMGSRSDPNSIAASLYGVLRDCDAMKADYIFSESFFGEGLGDAIMNRMLKAAAYHLISV